MYKCEILPDSGLTFRKAWWFCFSGKVPCKNPDTWLRNQMEKLTQRGHGGSAMVGRDRDIR